MNYLTAQIANQRGWKEADVSRVLFSDWGCQTRGQLSISNICYQMPPADAQKQCFYLEQEKDQPLFLLPYSPPGFTEPAPLDAAGALLPHLCTLTLRRYVSVALSSRSLALGVTQQVWSLGRPDFPQAVARNCLASSSLSSLICFYASSLAGREESRTGVEQRRLEQYHSPNCDRNFSFQAFSSFDRQFNPKFGSLSPFRMTGDFSLVFFDNLVANS